MDENRRNAILRLVFGAGGIGRLSFATGLPISFLLNPRKAMAQMAKAGQASTTCLDPTKAQRLVLATSGSGDPLNANVPGAFDDPAISHPPAATMAKTAIVQNGVSRTGAACWSKLSQELLDKAVFFHNATANTGHGQEPGALKIGNTIKNQEMLISALASQLAGCLGSVQKEPICVGGRGATEMLSYQGRVQPILAPLALANVLAAPTGPLANLQKLRDTTLDAMNDWYKTNATPGQADFLSRYAISQTELRQVSDKASTLLAGIKDNQSLGAQIMATTALFVLNVTSAVSIHIPWGGDNHGDANFANETRDQLAGVQAISDLYTSLKAQNLDQSTTFFTINVFGRTLTRTNGRDHNPNHHVTVMIGNGLKGGVVGGVTAGNGAMAINSSTGAGGQSGDIPANQTMAATGKTLARAVGLTEKWATDNITGGATVTAALASA